MDSLNQDDCVVNEVSAKAESAFLIIFGASGNLTARKLFPAVYNLFDAGRLEDKFCITGVARSSFTCEGFKERIRENLADNQETRNFQESTWEKFARHINYVQADGRNPGDFVKLAEFVKKKAEELGMPENVLLYLATPPTEYEEIILNLEKTGFTGMIKGWSRIVVEKPFGRDLKSAEKLNRILSGVFSEDQVYRIDHYLGKETVQNIMVFRFGNGIFEPVWNRRYIDHIQILIAESAGVENRGKYYEQAGALRDMVQNHMLQLLALTAMEPPVAFESEAIRDETVKVVKSIKPIQCNQVSDYVVSGQYDSGMVNGKEVSGYRNEAFVTPDSNTETYTALKVFIDNWRWAGVPFYLRTGKRLPSRATEIAIYFKQAPLLLFRKTDCNRIESNVLVLRIQPDEGIFMRFGAKVPGPSFRIGHVDMDFSYKKSFGEAGLTAYERLLYDFMLGDSSLFARRDGIDAMWKFIDPITEGWKNCAPPVFPNYKAGTWGPEAAEEFIGKDGRSWRIP
ncbi:MAG: glucose-6-phosphate dehydrogenase [Firmicutes bacterium]|nr:glucose-6-phosphate dehydrogenase [Bacillota bacterium]